MFVWPDRPTRIWRRHVRKVVLDRSDACFRKRLTAFSWLASSERRHKTARKTRKKDLRYRPRWHVKRLWTCRNMRVSTRHPIGSFSLLRVFYGVRQTVRRRTSATFCTVSYRHQLTFFWRSFSCFLNILERYLVFILSVHWSGRLMVTLTSSSGVFYIFLPF